MKRVMGWWVGAMGLVLAACTVPGLEELGPFACQSASDCATGYVCVSGQCASAGGAPGTSDAGTSDAGVPDSGTADAGTPDAGTADAGTSDAGVPDAGRADAGTPDGGADTTPPTLTLIVPLPTLRSPSGRTVYAEPGADGSPLPAAWRRDQEVTVEVRTDSPQPIALSLKGTDGKSVTVGVTPYTTGCSERQCARALLSMWKPQLDASRGSFTLTARVEDEAGNATVREASVPVTRFKWAYTLFLPSETENAVDGPPAIGAKGIVYVTTYYSKLTALDPDGQDGDSTVQGEGTPVVGNLSSGREILYVRAYENSTSSTYLATIDTTTGNQLARCPESPVSKLLFGGTLAVTNLRTTEEGVVATAWNESSSTSVPVIYQFRGNASGSGKQCQSIPTSIGSSERGNMVTRGSAYYFSQESDEITSLLVGSGSARSGWPIESNTFEGVNGIAVANDVLVLGEGDVRGTAKGGISVMNADSPSRPVLKYSGGAVASPVVGVGGAVFGVDRRGGRLVKAFLGGSVSDAIQSTEFGLSYSQSPTLGQGGFVYAMYPGQVGVFSTSNLALLWKWGPGVSSERPEVAPPVLDCTRDASGTPVSGRPGVLYAAIRNRMVALVVDSAGLDADAPWPKLQRDERNSGNKDTYILRCP